MYVELEIIDGNRVCVLGDKGFINDLIGESEVQNVHPCQLNEQEEKFTTQLTMTALRVERWNDTITKLMKMNIIAILEKKGFKIVTANMVMYTNQAIGRETIMLYKDYTNLV
jgi:hypothetical protein